MLRIRHPFPRWEKGLGGVHRNGPYTTRRALAPSGGKLSPRATERGSPASTPPRELVREDGYQPAEHEVTHDHLGSDPYLSHPVDRQHISQA